MILEKTIQLTWPERARPDGVLVHTDGHGVAGKAYFDPRPAPPPQIMGNFPWAEPADYREHQRTAGPQQASAFAGHQSKIRHAIERAEIRVRAVILGGCAQALKLVRAQDNGS